MTIRNLREVTINETRVIVTKLNEGKKYVGKVVFDSCICSVPEELLDSNIVRLETYAIRDYDGIEHGLELYI